MLYLSQVTIYSALLYTVYLLALKNRASHGWNRIYLLLCAALPVVIPFIKIPSLAASPVINTAAVTVYLPEINVFAKTTAGADSSFNWTNLLIAGYALIALALLSRSIIQYFAFRRFVQQHRCEMVNNVPVLLNTKTGPGSFQNYIFLPDDTVDPAIFDHEQAHIRLKHSSDILFMRLMRAIFWPNIVLYIICRELKIVHEFQADAYAVKNKDVYITTLLNDAFSTNQFSLAHTFFYHPLKRRIMMLQQTPLSRTKLRMAILKTSLLTATLLTGLVYLQNCTAQTAHTKQNKVQPEIVYDTIQAAHNGHSEVLTHANIMPHAEYKLADFLAKTLKYPESARKMGVEGRVIVKFIVNEDGAITHPVILRGVDSTLDAEALRSVQLMPPWIPGSQDGKNVAVYFTLPIVFSLGGDKLPVAGAREITAVPNPTAGSFTIQGSTGKPLSEVVSIEVTDMNGKVIHTGKAIAANGSLNAKVQLSSSTPNGMYVVNVRSTSINKTLHVLIQ